MVESTGNHNIYLVSVHASSSVDEGTDLQSKTTILFNTVNGQPTTTSTQTNQPTSSIISAPTPSISLDAGVVPGAIAPTVATSTSDTSLGPSALESNLTTAATSTSDLSLGPGALESNVTTAATSKSGQS